MWYVKNDKYFQSRFLEIYMYVSKIHMVSLSVAQTVKNLPVMQETQVQSLGWRRMGRSSGEGHGNRLQYSCLENPHGQRSLAGCSSWGRKESDMIEWLKLKVKFSRSVIETTDIISTLNGVTIKKSVNFKSKDQYSVTAWK